MVYNVSNILAAATIHFSFLLFISLQRQQFQFFAFPSRPYYKAQVTSHQATASRLAFNTTAFNVPLYHHFNLCLFYLNMTRNITVSVTNLKLNQLNFEKAILAHQCSPVAATGGQWCNS